jgi:hypothetical protein
MAVMLGALLMAIGHLVLGASEIAPTFLYLSLAIIVCGYGLFKSNVSCLLGELYEPTDPRRDGGFSLMYARQYRLDRRAHRLRLRAGRVQLGDGLRPGGRRHDRRAGDFPLRQPPFPHTRASIARRCARAALCCQTGAGCWCC